MSDLFVTQADKEAAVDLAHALNLTAEQFTSGNCNILVQHMARHRERVWADQVELDATDASHPAWWRGNDRGIDAAAERVEEALEGNAGKMGSVRLTAACARVAELTQAVSAMLERLSSTPMSISLAEWCEITGPVTAALHAPAQIERKDAK